MWAIERETVINHLSKEPNSGGRLAFQRRPSFGSGPEENGLPRIGIGDPFVENERSQEVDTIFNLVEEFVGKKIEDRDSIRMHGDA
jgi:hypothetical protein